MKEKVRIALMGEIIVLLRARVLVLLKSTSTNNVRGILATRQRLASKV